MTNTNLTKIYIVRHGESKGNINVENDHLPGSGSSLSENGEFQAKGLAKKLTNVHFDAAFSSDLARAKQTAEIIAEENTLAVQTTERIRERSITTFLQKHPDKTRDLIEPEIQKALEGLDDSAKMSYKHTADFESADEAASRLLTFLREIAVGFAGKTILVVAHGNLMRSTLTHLGWCAFDELPKGSIDNTGYFVLASDGIDFFVKETEGIHKQKNMKRGW